MTTIALKDMKVAFDSSSTNNHMVLITDSDKMVVDKENSFVCFHAGHVQCLDDYLDIYREHKDIWHRHFSYKKKANLEDYYLCVFIIVNYSTYTISVLEFTTREQDSEEFLIYFNVLLSLDSVYSVGSGREFAYGVMDFGGTAKQAVEIAALRDKGTGGKISEVDLVELGKNLFNVDILNRKKIS